MSGEGCINCASCIPHVLAVPWCGRLSRPRPALAPPMPGLPLTSFCRRRVQALQAALCARGLGGWHPQHGQGLWQTLHRKGGCAARVALGVSGPRAAYPPLLAPRTAPCRSCLARRRLHSWPPSLNSPCTRPCAFHLADPAGEEVRQGQRVRGGAGAAGLRKVCRGLWRHGCAGTGAGCARSAGIIHDGCARRAPCSSNEYAAIGHGTCLPPPQQPPPPPQQRHVCPCAARPLAACLLDHTSLTLRSGLCAGIQISDADEFLPTLEKALEMQARMRLAPTKQAILFVWFAGGGGWGRGIAGKPLVWRRSCMSDELVGWRLPGLPQGGQAPSRPAGCSVRASCPLLA